MFERENSPSKQKLRGVKFQRQVLEHYLTGFSNISSDYGIFTIVNLSPQSSNQQPRLIQTDGIEFHFSKLFTESIKNIQHQNSPTANSIFKNEVFSINYGYFSIY